MTLLSIRNLKKSFGAFVATDIDSLDIKQGEMHALIGPNGAGKTTLIRQIVGEYKPDTGNIIFKGTDITHISQTKRAHMGISRSFQITSVFLDLPVLENCLIALQAHNTGTFNIWKKYTNQPDLIEQAVALLQSVGLSDFVHTKSANLAHGQLRALEIAMALATKPAFMLLDEPMAGMGVLESQKMMQLIETVRGKITVLLIEHDMEAVFQLADRISVLVLGSVIATGTPDFIRNDTATKEAYLGH